MRDPDVRIRDPGVQKGIQALGEGIQVGRRGYW